MLIIGIELNQVVSHLPRRRGNRHTFVIKALTLRITEHQVHQLLNSRVLSQNSNLASSLARLTVSLRPTLV